MNARLNDWIANARTAAFLIVAVAVALVGFAGPLIAVCSYGHNPAWLIISALTFALCMAG